jgi:hypothetical protein
MENAKQSDGIDGLVRDITIVKKDGSTSSGVIAIGYPYKSHVHDHWSCDVMISEVLPKQVLHGGDALQALLFAVNHAPTHVEIAQNDGIMLYWDEEGDLCGLVSG